MKHPPSSSSDASTRAASVPQEKKRKEQEAPEEPLSPTSTLVLPAATALQVSAFFGRGSADAAEGTEAAKDGQLVETAMDEQTQRDTQTEICLKYRSETHLIATHDWMTVLQLKEVVAGQTKVPPHRQKLLGFVKVSKNLCIQRKEKGKRKKKIISFSFLWREYGVWADDGRT